ncbi:MAG: DNA translocase FtsK 4TM domain-containing protein [Anaerovoracaceae bacterium]|jgi:S-DNA-T family DNA segregation ATPase FtsK/SpoIIIE
MAEKKGGKRGKKAASTQTNTEGQKKEKKPKIKSNPAGSRMRDEIVSVILVALGIFIIIAELTNATGKVGSVLSMVFKGCFGLAAYILPFYLIVYALLVLTNKTAHINSRTIVCTIIMFFDIDVLLSIRYPAVKEDYFGLSYIIDMFDKGIDLESAGAVGMTIGWGLVKLVDIIGLILIAIVVLIICIILIANTPVSEFFDNRRIKRNQKKINALEEKTESGPSDPSLDTQPIPVQNAEAAEQSSASEQKAKNGKKGKSKTDQPVQQQPAGAGQEAQQYNDAYGQTAAYSTDGEPSGGSGGSDNGLSSFIPSFITGRKKDSDDDVTAPVPTQAGSGGSSVFRGSKTDNKRQILDYVNDDSLFKEGEGDGSEEDDRTGLGFAYEDLGKNPAGSSATDGIWADASGADQNEAGETAGSDENSGSDISDIVPDGAESAAAASALKNAANSAAAQKASAADLAKAAASVAKAAGNPGETNANNADGKKYQLPPLDLLNKSKRKADSVSNAELRNNAASLEQVLHDFGVDARVTNVNRGPSVTRYEVQPATGVKVSKIVSLSDDIALNLRAKSLRIEAPIPGKAAVGIEVQNDHSEVVSLREMIGSSEFQNAKSKISFVVGEDVTGRPVVADLKSMPHMLIAGSTGSGKSVCINSIILSMLYKATPDEVKFILIDPKVVELATYNGIPHMLIPVVTDPAKAAAALAWAVQEMEARYKKFAKEKVKDLKSFNKKMNSEQRTDEVMPQIVIIIDELADLMMAAAKQVEESICRLAQLARAAGMHIIVATQRPSVDVVTGLIKANVPSRIAFAVSSQVDSRTILDRAGAEKLVGKGDMLFKPVDADQPVRLQGPFVTDEEVAAVTDFWKAQDSEETDSQENMQQVMQEINTVSTGFVDSDDDEDELFSDAVALVINAGQASASMLQRRFRIGYNRAGRLIDTMEAKGIIGPSEGSKPRKVLVTQEEYEASRRGAAQASDSGSAVEGNNV